MDKFRNLKINTLVHGTWYDLLLLLLLDFPPF